MRSKTLLARTKAQLAGTAIVVAAGIVGLQLTAAGPAATQRPIEEWLEAQGTWCLNPDFTIPNEPCEGTPPDCLLFVDPIENFVGWSDPVRDICASVDYAGLAERWVQDESNGTFSFGTSHTGSVTERRLRDGRAEVRVTLHTTNALLWVVDGCDFANGPLLMGDRAPEVLGGADCALADCTFQVVFTNTEPGADLPDLMQVGICPEPGQEVLFMAVRVRGSGPLRALFGVPDGTPGMVQITETGLFMTGFHGAVQDGWPVEHIKLQVIGE